MSKFGKGDKVININTKEKGFVIEVYPMRRGRQLYKVKYDDRENDENSIYLMPDVDLTDPFERIRQNIYGHYTEYLKGNTSFKIQSSNNSTISSLKASRTLFRAYQFKPLLKYLNSDSKRLLIADEVGLGKTIEAGHIMLELKARGEFHNALVICPMSLRAKWTTELNEKFGLEFMDIDKKVLIIAERFSLSDWILISDDLTPQFIRRVVYSSHQFSVVFKDGPLSELREALSAVNRHTRYLSQRALETIITQQQQEEEIPSILTQTETEIVKAIALGKTTKEIAAERFSSIHTVTTHRKNIFRKLGINTAHEAVKYALRAGLIDPSEFYI